MYSIEAEGSCSGYIMGIKGTGLRSGHILRPQYDLFWAMNSWGGFSVAETTSLDNITGQTHAGVYLSVWINLHQWAVLHDSPLPGLDTRYLFHSVFNQYLLHLLF